LLGFWHLMSFAIPALVVGGLTALIAKRFRPGEFRATTGLRLGAVASTASALGYLCSVVLLRHDGMMTAYAAIVVCSAVSVVCFARKAMPVQGEIPAYKFLS
jgi:hypothetical protein